MGGDDKWVLCSEGWAVTTEWTLWGPSSLRAVQDDHSPSVLEQDRPWARNDPRPPWTLELVRPSTGQHVRHGPSTPARGVRGPPGGDGSTVGRTLRGPVPPELRTGWTRVPSDTEGSRPETREGRTKGRSRTRDGVVGGLGEGKDRGRTGP